MSTGMVTVTCSECGGAVGLSARWAREIVRPYVCKLCRGVARTRPASSVVTDAEREFWIQRFGLSGAIELSIAIWGPNRKAQPALAVSQERLVASVGDLG